MRFARAAFVALALAPVACKQGDNSAHSTAPISFIPDSWTKPAWFIDPANVTGHANDSSPNTCTTAMDPCLTFAGVAMARWGTNSPRLRQNTTITFLSSHFDDSDPVYLTPFIEHGAFVLVQGVLGAAQQVPNPTSIPNTITKVVGKNRATGQLLQAMLPPGAAPGQLVVNGRTSSRAWVYKNAGATDDWFFSQPLSAVTVTSDGVSTTFPGEDDSWKEGDPVTLYNPVLVNLVQVEPTLVDLTGTVNNLTVYALGVLAPSSDFIPEMQLNSAVYFIESSIGRITKLGTSPADLLPVFANVDFANDTILGFGDPYQHLTIDGGQLRSPAFFGDVRGGDVDHDFIIGGQQQPPGSGFNMTGGGYGTVFVDSGLTLQFGGGARVFPANSGPNNNVLWGPGGVSVLLKTRLEYLPGANEAQATFLQTGGFTMNGSATPCATDLADSMAFKCGIPLTAANLDAPVAAGGFGGTAIVPGGASISNTVVPPALDAGASDAAGDADASDADGGIGSGLVCSVDAGSAPAGPPVCGDGWRDPATEECDDGLGSVVASSRRACSARCQVLDELAVETTGTDGGLSNVSRTLGAGRHPIAVGDSSFAAAYLEPGVQPLSLSLATFTSKGAAAGTPVSFSVQSTVTEAANPVLAALSCNRYVAAWTDLNGDGDELGVALRVVDPSAPPTAPPEFANTTTALSQYDPDIVWTGSQIVVAWVDTSNPLTAPDVRMRTFDASLNPTSPEQSLAATADSEGDVSLTTFAAAWAAAWRDDADGLESIRVHTPSVDWIVGPFLPGPSGDKPGLAQLDATHLALVYSVGIDSNDSGVADGSKIQVAVLDTGSPGNVAGGDIPTSAANFVGVSRGQPNAVALNGEVFLAWRTEARPGDAAGEELWLKSLGWNGLTLDTSAAEIPLPRWPQGRVGDQRAPVMAASALPPQGALVLGWDDFGKGLARGEGNGDVVVEFAPLPILRSVGDGGP